MTKFETIGRTVATITLTILASATMLLGAVGPAQLPSHEVSVTRSIA